MNTSIKFKLSYYEIEKLQKMKRHSREMYYKYK